MKLTKKKLITAVTFAAAVNIFATIAIIFLVVFNNTSDEPQQHQTTETFNDDADVFYAYLEKSLKDNSVALEDSYTSKNTEFATRGIVDAKAQKYSLSATFTCSALYNGKLVGVKSSIQAENASIYLRLDDIEGVLGDASTGASLDLPDAFARVKGNWYKSEDDTAIQSQIDSGVYAFTTSILAPGYDSNKILEIVEKNNLYDIQSSKKVGKNYEFNIRVQKDNYIRTLSEAFPKLASVEAIATSGFGTTNQTLDSKLTLTEDGKFVSEEMTVPNQCTNILDVYLGPGYKDVPATASGASQEKPETSIVIPPVTNARPLTSIEQDLSL